VVRLLPEALEINDELAERDPVLAQLAAAAVSGLPVPSGPRAYPPCPCPTRLRRARRRRSRTALPSCRAARPHRVRRPHAHGRTGRATTRVQLARRKHCRRL
jgi:hypothetical protein